MNLNPYLGFNGNCREAFEFYARLFGGKIEMMMTAGDSPMAAQTPPDRLNAVMHARLSIGSDVLMGGDAPPDCYQKPAGITVSWQAHGIAEAERLFAGLAEGGVVTMPIQQTFWAVRFGMCTDRYGTPWMINCEKDA